MTNQIDPNKKIVVCGAGGFIGGAILADLRRQGYTNLRGVDRKPLNRWYQRFSDVENRVADLQFRAECFEALQGMDECFNFAADMGGMGFIENNKALCMLSVLINTHLLEACRHLGVERYFYASSACVYAGYKQKEADIPGLKEEDAYPADPEDGYGWEKLFSERMCRHFREDFGVRTRMARYHNVYGPNGTFDGGREKAPAAICRKIIGAKLASKHEIEIWGDGKQTRSFMFIEDCVKGTQAIMASEVLDAINLGSDEMVSINQLVGIVEELSGITVKRSYNLDAPKGVRGRSSDNTRIKQELDWAPDIRLRAGMEKTYAWIYDQMVSGNSKDSVVNIS